MAFRMPMVFRIPEVDVKRLSRCLPWLARVLGYLLLAVVVLVITSPVLLLLLVIFGSLISTALVALGCALVLASAAAYLLHALLGLSFWFWMIFTCTGALLLMVATLTNTWSGGVEHTAGTQPQSACSPFPWLLAALLFTHWWGGHGQ